LRYCVGPIKKEDRHFLISGSPHVHSTVYVVSGSIPGCLSGKDFHPIGFSPISVLNRQRFTAYNHRYPMKWIDVPGRGHAGF
jgi:hypothetical protein